MANHAAIRGPVGAPARCALLCVLLAFAAGCESVGRPPAGAAGVASGTATAPAPAAPVEAAAGGAEIAFGGDPTPLEASSPALAGPEIYSGSGELVGGIGAGRAEVPMSGNGRVSLNFADADIREVVDVVLGDTLGLNYIIDPQVQGTVLARTSEPLDREDVIPALESILSLNGAALRLVNGVYHVVPMQVAARSLPQSRSVVAPGARANGFSVTVIPLRFASAESIHRVISGFVPPDRVFQADSERNLLIFAGTGTEANDLVELVRLFDVDWMAGMSFGLFPVETADVNNLVGELDQVFGQDVGGPLAGLVRFVPISRMSAILAISPQRTYLDRARQWIERLDRGEGSATRRIYVYYVQNSRAEDLAEILSQVFVSGGGSDEPTGLQADLAPGLTPVDLRTPTRPAVAEQATAEGEPEAPAEPEYRATGGDGRAGAIGRGAGVGALVQESGDVRIIADDKNNALVILASAAEYRMIEATLRRLDVVPLQVLIEVTIAEVTLNDTLEYGLEWFFSQGDSSFTFSDAGALATSGLPGFSFVFENADALVVLNALTTVSDVKVVSSPQLMVLDNQSASLQVGEEVPILTQSLASTTGDISTSVTNSVQYRDTGVLLEITPRVNAGGLVVLDIIQEISDAIETTFGVTDSPTFTQRRVETSVAVQSGQTVAIGGLIEETRTDGERGIPLLSSIPILGNLFKTTTEAADRTELLILITPRVVRNAEEAREVTDELRRRMKSVVPLERRALKGNDYPAPAPTAEP